MDNRIVTGVKLQKKWTAPTLKKTDIHQITAIGGGTSKDGTASSKS